ncbi:MAG: class I SAM-dependent methyltransferase [Actinobacteria bacterium]|nr:class I SAM-dependent methyltransferase [Actinomycetota bacterium]
MNWLVHRIASRALERVVADYARGVILDIGCGDKPYEKMLEPYESEHIGMDHEGTLHDLSKADIKGEAYAIPLDDESVDTVFCTAVLEHLEDPARALSEAYRVLKRGGHAIYTAPLFWHHHEEPRDFFRYTPYGLGYLFSNAGFEVIEILPLSGFWVTFGQELVYYIWRFRRGAWQIPCGGRSPYWVD